jgi:hypothetical protein
LPVEKLSFSFLFILREKTGERKSGPLAPARAGGSKAPGGGARALGFLLQALYCPLG